MIRVGINILRCIFPKLFGLKIKTGRNTELGLHNEFGGICIGPRVRRHCAAVTHIGTARRHQCIPERQVELGRGSEVLIFITQVLAKILGFEKTSVEVEVSTQTF